MDKRKAIERSRVLKNFLGLLSNKRLPQLEKMLEDSIKYQQMKQFKDWCGEIPDSLIQLFNQKHSVLFQESEKEKFYPALFFGDNTNLCDILYNLYINREKMQEYGLLNIDKLNSILTSLEFIIANDKNLFLKLFQNKNLKQKVEMTKLTVEKDIGVIDDLEAKIYEWDNFVVREVSGDQIQKAISLYQVYTKNRFSEEFPLMMFCNTKLYSMYKSMYKFTKNHLVEQIELLWSRLAEERVEKELSCYLFVCLLQY